PRWYWRGCCWCRGVRHWPFRQSLLTKLTPPRAAPNPFHQATRLTAAAVRGRGFSRDAFRPARAVAAKAPPTKPLAKTKRLIVNLAPVPLLHLLAAARAKQHADQ